MDIDKSGVRDDKSASLIDKSGVRKDKSVNKNR